jgi:hypothetical protein
MTNNYATLAVVSGRRVLPLTALLLVCAVAGAELTPLTETRYAPVPGFTQLRSNGRDVFAFWSDYRVLRATRITDAVPRPGHVVMTGTVPEQFDAVWTGSRFIVVQHSSDPSTSVLTGRYLDAVAQPVGEEFDVARQAKTPKLAVSGPVTMLAYFHHNATRLDVSLLGSNGRFGVSAGTFNAYQEHALAGSDAGFALLYFDRDSRTLRLTLMDRDATRLASPVLGQLNPYAMAVASDGRRYLAAWLDDLGLQCAIVEPDGTAGPVVLLDAAAKNFTDPSIAWTGDGWSIAYERGSVAIVHLDARGQQVLQREDTKDVQDGAPSIVPGFVAWQGQQITVGSSLPLTSHTPVPITIKATWQELLAAAASAQATLVVWKEQGIVRTGLRTHDGQWSERELSRSDVWAAVAASDGREFVVLADAEEGTLLFRLDERGEAMPPIVLPPAFIAPLPYRHNRLAIIWDGSWYALVYGQFARRMSRRGLLTAPVNIGDSFSGVDRLALATNGNGFQLAGERWACGMGRGCWNNGIVTLDLGPDLTPIGEERELGRSVTFLAGVVWTGSGYQVVTRGTYYWESYVTAILAPGGTPAIALPGTVEVGGYFHRVDPWAEWTVRPELVTIDGALAYLGSTADPRPPHYGAVRIGMQILGSGARPGAPTVRAERIGDRIEIAWTPPPGTIQGYRVEWSTDDSAFVEEAGWFGPGELQTSLPIPPGAGSLEVRVRAFNDAGAGAYSNEVRLTFRRRRALR